MSVDFPGHRTLSPARVKLVESKSSHTVHRVNFSIKPIRIGIQSPILIQYKII